MSGAVLRPELGTRAELNTISRGCVTNTESERPADCGFGSGQQQQQVLVFKRSELRSLAASVTVAILAQGTSWAVAVTQAFLLPGSILVVRGGGQVTRRLVGKCTDAWWASAFRKNQIFSCGHGSWPVAKSSGT